LDEHDPAVAVASECSKLERELNAANDRIKRLEEAGDMMEKLLPEGSICDKAAIRWTKAREAKL
jgi:hypothetical protein